MGSCSCLVDLIPLCFWLDSSWIHTEKALVPFWSVRMTIYCRHGEFEATVSLRTASPFKLVIPDSRPLHCSDAIRPNVSSRREARPPPRLSQLRSTGEVFIHGQGGDNYFMPVLMCVAALPRRVSTP